MACPLDVLNPTNQFIAVCRFAEPIALTSIFPYSWVMVKDFNIGDKSNASFYAGIIISAFALSESLTGMFWGSLSDKVGRKPVLLLGCAGTVLSLMIVGFSRNFWMALLGRVVGGLLNGNVGVIQTMVGEVVKNPDHERKLRRSDIIFVTYIHILTYYSASICCYAICLVYWDNHRPRYIPFPGHSFFLPYSNC